MMKKEVWSHRAHITHVYFSRLWLSNTIFIIRDIIPVIPAEVDVYDVCGVSTDVEVGFVADVDAELMKSGQN